MSASAFGELTVIANPNAGGGRVRDRLPALERALERRDLPYALHVTAERDEATVIAREAIETGGRFLVAVGGDGTVQQVLNGAFPEGGAPTVKPVLGVVGADTGCDLLRTFGLPGDVEGGVGHLTGANVYPLDVMKVTFTASDGERVARYAHNLAEVGMGGRAARAERRLSPRIGKARPFVGFWVGVLGSRPRRVKVEADTRAYEGPAFNVVVGNAQYTNRGLRMSPRSFPGDGELDVLVFAGPRSDAITMLPRIFRHGDHVPDPHIREMRAKIRITVDADRALPVVADGEPFGRTPATFQIVPQQVLLKL